MRKDSKIFVAGGTGLVGSAIVKNLLEKGYTNIVTTYHKRLPATNYPLLTYIQLDLLDPIAVAEFFESEKPEYVFLAAAKVGGIVANNTYRAEFIYENLQIQNNVIHQSYLNGVKKLMFLGSTCIYPKNCPQPMKEEYLLTSELEYTNEPYAIAKIAGIKMCESYNLQYGTNYISVMPTNLYGPNDNFDLEKSHVLPALIRKIHLGKALEKGNWEIIRKDLNKLPIEGIDGNASEEEILKILEKYGIKIVSSEQLVVSSSNKKEKLPTTNYPLQTTHSVKIEIWGSGKPMREFLWSEDMADACVYLMENIDVQDIVSSKKEKTTHYPLPTTHFLNIGTGKDISIKDLAYLIKEIVGFKGEFYFNTQKPDGTMKKLTDPSKLNSLGWRHSVELKEGIERIYNWYHQ
jgi:GDP-L-fucose synthase